MQHTLNPHMNGVPDTVRERSSANAPAKRDVWADLEECIRRGAEAPPVEATALHAFLKDAKGILHIGAHTGQEREAYGGLPVVWVEPLEPAYKVLLEKIAGKPRQVARQHLIADGKAHKFGVSNNAGQSSSIFDFADHKKLWPAIGYVGQVEMQSITLEQFIDWYGLNLDTYDTLILDVQGAELLVLQGAGDLLQRFRWVMVEAADFESYKGGCTLAQIEAHMQANGFARWVQQAGKAVPGVGGYFDTLYRNVAKTADLPPGEFTITEEGEEEAGDADGFVDPQPAAPVRLNIGSAGIHLAGFTAIDRDSGGEAWPLDVADESVDEILASHVLEHFSHRDVGNVLAHWVQKLKPGGRIRIAVPDFEEVAKLYLAGAPVNVQGYVMGGHCDRNDRHGCLFDREALTETMIHCGLERIGLWDGIPGTCSDGPHSLNLMGFKPSGPERTLENVRAVMSVPRFGPLMHPRCADKAFYQLRIPAKTTQSCYWHQQICVLMAKAIEDPACEFVLTMDFDTVFSAADVLELYRLLKACPDVAAVFPLQSKRSSEQVLMSLQGSKPGTVRGAISEADLMRHLLPAHTGHFGLTLIRADVLRKLPRPWMQPAPNADGDWEKGQRDADIDFWYRLRAAGYKACLAPRVVVGHLEEVVKWPGKDLQPVYQGTGDYDESGIPAAVAR